MNANHIQNIYSLTLILQKCMIRIQNDLFKIHEKAIWQTYVEVHCVFSYVQFYSGYVIKQGKTHQIFLKFPLFYLSNKEIQRGKIPARNFLSFEKEFQNIFFCHFLPYLYTKTDFAIAFVVYVIAKGILQQHLSFYPG